MNVVLNIKEIQLPGVLKELEKIGKGVDVVVNIKGDGSKSEDGFKEESEGLVKDEIELMQEEMREKVLGNIDA